MTIVAISGKTAFAGFKDANGGEGIINVYELDDFEKQRGPSSKQSQLWCAISAHHITVEVYILLTTYIKKGLKPPFKASLSP